MANLGMRDVAYPLTTEEVNAHVEENKIGNYAFGKPAEREWRVFYVGRSDTDLREEIKQQARKHGKLDVTGCEFQFSYATCVTDAYEKECQNFHDFKDSIYCENKIHPAKPKDNGHYKCPVKGCPENE